MNIENSLNNEQSTFVIQSIEKLLNNASKLSRKCQEDAGSASSNKRTGRIVNSTLGILAALLGVAVSQIPEHITSLRIFIGTSNAVIGAAIVATAQLLDPAKSRKRAIDLQLLKTKLENFSDTNRIKFLGMKDDKDHHDIDEMIKLHYDLAEELTQLQEKAFNLGVDV